MNDAQDLARHALARLPRPYAEDVILRVFCEIEHTLDLYRSYRGLLRPNGGYSEHGLNSQIGKSVRLTLKAGRNGKRTVDRTRCSLIKSFSLLTRIDSDWTWDD